MKEKDRFAKAMVKEIELCCSGECGHLHGVPENGSEGE